jgi:hypothetical protein
MALGAALESSGPCESTQTNPYGCLGIGILLVVVGVPLVTLGIAVALRGRGAFHSLVGSVVCVAGSLQVELRLAHSLPGLSELGGSVLIVLLVGVGVWLWARYAPGRAGERRTSA